eukprot:5248696-Prymnesium_polylepis.1
MEGALGVARADGVHRIDERLAGGDTKLAEALTAEHGQIAAAPRTEEDVPRLVGQLLVAHLKQHLHTRVDEPREGAGVLLGALAAALDGAAEQCRRALAGVPASAGDEGAADDPLTQRRHCARQLARDPQRPAV